jgi:hypothetical protein
LPFKISPDMNCDGYVSHHQTIDFTRPSTHTHTNMYMCEHTHKYTLTHTDHHLIFMVKNMNFISKNRKFQFDSLNFFK